MFNSKIQFINAGSIVMGEKYGMVVTQPLSYSAFSEKFTWCRRKLEAMCFPNFSCLCQLLAQI